MTRSFGFERQRSDLLIALVSRRLVTAVMVAGSEVEMVAFDVSCRQQIEHLAGRRARHPAEVLWESLRG